MDSNKTGTKDSTTNQAELKAKSYESTCPPKNGALATRGAGGSVRSPLDKKSAQSLNQAEKNKTFESLRAPASVWAAQSHRGPSLSEFKGPGARHPRMQECRVAAAPLPKEAKQCSVLAATLTSTPP